MNNKKTAFGYIFNTLAIALILFLFFNYQNNVTLAGGENFVFFSKKLVPNLWQCCYFIILVTSLNMVLGFLGQLSLGHCGFMAIGAYTAALGSLAFQRAEIITDEHPLYLLMTVGVILAGGLLSALVGFVVGIPALRLKGDYLAIITLGFGMIIVNIINNIPWCGDQGLAEGSASATLYKTGLSFSSKEKVAYSWLAIVITLICVIMMFMFIRSKYGRAIKAIRDDEIAASASGLNVSFYKILTFAYSAFFAGIAGGIYTCTIPSLSTSSFAFTNNGILNSIFIVVMVVVGGMGSLTGSIVSAVLMFFLNYYIKNVVDTSSFPVFVQNLFNYPMLVYAIALIVLIMFRPRGIFGTYEFSPTGIVYSIVNKIKGIKTKKSEGGSK